MKPTRSEHVGLLIGRFRRLITGAATQRLEREGRSIHEYRVLAELGRGGPRAQADLAVATAQHPAAISRLVDELESAALVRRRRATADRRQIIVELTPAGRARYRAERPHVQSAIDDVLAPLSPRAQHRLIELLETVVTAHVQPVARKRGARR
jgi:DNA-binding MarR family transcriptional regulator